MKVGIDAKLHEYGRFAVIGRATLGRIESNDLRIP